jgi:hypothetical protein
VKASPCKWTKPIRVTRQSARRTYKKNLKAKGAVVALVDKSKGKVRAFHVKDVNSKTVRALLVAHASRKSTLVPTKLVSTRKSVAFIQHKRVFHKHGWYVTDDGFTTNKRRELFRHLQEEPSRHVSILQRTALAAVLVRIFVPL